MIVEVLLTLLMGAGVCVIIFMVFFNTKTVELNQKDNKKRGKGKGKKGKNQQSKKSPKAKIKPSKSNKSNKKAPVIFYNPALNKPKVKLEDHENLISMFRGHTGEITGIGWHQSGKCLLSSGKDKMIYLWGNPIESQQTWEPLGKIKTEDDGYFSMLNTIVTVKDDKEKKEQQWNDDNDDEKGKKNKDKHNPLKNYSDLSNSVFAATNGCFGLNSYGLSKPQKQQNNNTKYNYRKASVSKEIKIHLTSNIQTDFTKEDMNCMIIHPKLKFVACSGSHNTKIYFYDVKAKKRQQDTGRKIKVGIKPRNKQELKSVLANADKPMEVIDGGQFVNYQMNMSPDCNYLSIGTFKKDIRLWRINYLKPGKRDIVQESRFGSTELLCSIINAHNASIICVTFSCDSKYMVSASKDGFIKVWNIIDIDYARGNKPTLVFQQDLGIAIDYVVMSYQYNLIAVMDPKRTSVYIYKIKYEKKKIKLHCKFENLFKLGKEVRIEGKVNVIKFSPDSQFIAIGSNDFDVRVYQIPAHKKSAGK